MVRHVGEMLLGLGFALIVTAAVIRDPTALDANIGAGLLNLIGIPVGAVGALLTVAGVIRDGRRRPN